MWTIINDYFEKYTHNYDIWDYIRLIRYYDNALFKMVKDYVPARTSLATGIVFIQHILERLCFVVIPYTIIIINQWFSLSKLSHI